jgi:serine/threonine protein kinase
MPPEVLDPNYEYAFDADSSDSATTDYASPFTKRSDVYSLGMMNLLEVLAGKTPYSRGTFDNIVILDIWRRPPPWPEKELDGLQHVLPENSSTSSIMMCRAGHQALSPPSPGHSSPSQAGPCSGLAAGLGLASGIRRLTLELKPGL